MDLPISRTLRQQIIVDRSMERFRSGMPIDQVIEMDTMESARHGFHPKEVAWFFRDASGHLVHKAFVNLEVPATQQVDVAWQSYFKRFPQARTRGTSVTLSHE